MLDGNRFDNYWWLLEEYRCDETKWGVNSTNMWDDFVKELWDYLFPEFAQQEARSKLIPWTKRHGVGVCEGVYWAQTPNPKFFTKKKKLQIPS